MTDCNSTGIRRVSVCSLPLEVETRVRPGYEI